jgi:anaerobic magnesium-protoporphyrin IX monomethyl ester cyclase
MVRMGIQTGSERTKQLYKRKFSNEHILEAAKIINEHKDKVELPVYDVIVDNPYETDEDVIDTLMFMSKLPVPFKLNRFGLFLFPGTPLYETVKQDGRLDEFTHDFRSQDIATFELTYWNKLFVLIDTYARQSKTISPFKMFLLTNKIMRFTRLSLLLYIVFDVFSGSSPLEKVKGMLTNVLGDLSAGNVSRLLKRFKT